MDELRNQLQRLGEAAEADVTPVEATQITASASSGTPTRIDTGQHVAPANLRSTGRRKLPRGVLLGAAAALLVVVGSLTLVDRSMPEEAVGVTSAEGEGEPTERAVPDDNGWADLRFCESTADYTADTGNTFYGAYQFTWPTFRETAERVGLDQYAGLNPAWAPPEVQDAIANALYLEAGSDPWPVCGRFVRGPMITPVIPQWLSASRFNGNTAIFIDPEVTEDGVVDISRAISATISGSQLSPLGFVSKEESFQEFQLMFDGNDDLSSSVAVQDMPPRFEFVGSSSEALQQQLQDIPGVFEVVEDSGGPLALNEAEALHVSIPAIGVDEPVHPSARTEFLEVGVVALGATSQHTIIGGFGSVETSVFERFGELRNGDTVIVSSLVGHGNGAYEITQTFTIDLPTEDAAPEVTRLDEIDSLSPSSTTELILVTNVADDPALRWVVQATPVAPDLTRYVLPDDAP